jgi:hypothetical protein
MFYQARVSVFVHADVSRICDTGEPTACFGVIFFGNG